MLVAADIVESEFYPACQVAELLNGGIQAEIFLLLKFAIVVGDKRQYPNLMRFKTIEITQLPRYPCSISVSAI
jgi:hypothetical protein